MIADNKDLNVDAASRWHAISTHAVVTEFDFYTAVDALKPSDGSGAGMIGTVDYNTACYYRYANVDLTQLAANLDGDEGLVGRVHRGVPGGEQNLVAARTIPDTLLAVVREHGAWNLASAFLRAVTEADLMTISTKCLLKHYGNL